MHPKAEAHLHFSKSPPLAPALAPAAPALAPSRNALQLGSSSSSTATMHSAASSSGASSSGASTPISHRRSSTSSYAVQQDGSTPNSSTGQVNMPMRSSMKSNLKKSNSVGTSLNRQSAPPTVRFSELPPLPRRDTEPVRTINYSKPTSPPSPLYQNTRRFSLGPHQYRPKNIRLSTHLPASPTSPVHTPPPQVQRNASQMSALRPLSYQQSISHRRPIEKRLSVPAIGAELDPRLDPRWSGIPLPAGYKPPAMLGTTQRATSYHSMISNFSASSTPPALAPPATKLQNYDPLDNYVPCMAAMCTAHYTAAHSGPAYYLSQEPYKISRHHGYCPRHASKEMKEANALCKREYERMRQSAGRKTLGEVADDFEAFMELFREERTEENAQLQQRQKQIVLGTTKPNSKSSKERGEAKWNWRYTPRPCTKQGCKNPYYSPYATHLFSFYAQRRPATGFLPLSTLCPQCSQAEVEAFEAKIDEKRSSRCGWDEKEWDEWHSNAKRDREMETEFWEKAQERVLGEKHRAPLSGGKAAHKGSTTPKVEPNVAPKLAPKTKAVDAPREPQPSVSPAPEKKAKRRSIFRKMFGISVSA